MNSVRNFRRMIINLSHNCSNVGKPCARTNDTRLILRQCSTTTPRTTSCTSPSTPPQSHSVAPSPPKRALLDGPNLRDFFKDEHLRNVDGVPECEIVPYLQQPQGAQQRVFFDVYGCQMNVNDTEIIWAILRPHGFVRTATVEDADVVLIVTCAIRDSAETKIWHRLNYLNAVRNKRRKRGCNAMKIALLGCMAERLKERIIERERSVDVIAGPDAYKDLPRLLAVCEDNQTAINVMLSSDETYADIVPVRLDANAVTAYVSIMRGCDNMCTYCIVPFTRGRERSRPIASILQEVEQLSERGVKEVTLLGQNVNSYRDLTTTDGNNKYYDAVGTTNLAEGFKTVYKSKVGGLRFADLLYRVAEIDPEMRIRFTSPHPKDFPDEVLQVIGEKANICKSLHLPAQSGNSNVLERMRRGYTREAYLQLVDNVRNRLPNVHLSSDFICGFCGETEAEFADTLSLIDTVRYHNAYLFAYSMREKTTAHRRYQDDVPAPIKKQRMDAMIKSFRTHAETLNRACVGETHLVLVEGVSKRSRDFLQGRNDGHIKVILPAGEIPARNGSTCKTIGAGDYVVVQINAATSQVLKGIPLYHTTLQEHAHYSSVKHHNHYCM